MKLATGIATLTLAIASVYSIPVNAEEVFHGNVSGPTARCQGPLPIYDDVLRKRPLTLQNVSTEHAFVTCSFEVDAVNAVDNTVLLLDTYFSTAGTEPVDVFCTAVSGYQTGINEYVSQTITIDPDAPPPGIPQGNAFWFDTDFENGLDTGLISISCSLPPGVAVNDTLVVWVADDLTEPSP